LTGNFFVYFGLLAWSHSRDFVAWYREQELTAAQLTAEIARSRFQALCVQVRPQFLLGTLDLLARLVHVDVPRAERLIARLADVLRLTLEMAREPVTTLEQELQLLAVTVEAHRLGVRPAVSLDESIDPAALDTIMPSRLLCTMVDDLLAAEPEGAATPLVVGVRAERASDTTRIRLHGEAAWKSGGDLHAWWRKKSAAEAAVAEAGPLVTVAFPDRMTAVLIIADERPATAAEAVAA
jgi:LytS/YehU family sensor histidine kinase